MLKLIMFIFVVGVFNTAYAGSVKWELEPMELNIHTENFEIISTNVEMTCTLSDGSELFQEIPLAEVESELTDLKMTGAGHRYLLETNSAYLSARQIFAKLRSCNLILNIVSDIEEPVVGGIDFLQRRIDLASAVGDELKVKSFVSEDQASQVEMKFKSGISMTFDEKSFFISVN